MFWIALSSSPSDLQTKSVPLTDFIAKLIWSQLINTMMDIVYFELNKDTMMFGLPVFVFCL